MPPGIAERTGWGIRQRRAGRISASRRATWQFFVRIELDIRLQVIQRITVRILFLVLERPLVCRIFDLLQVVDAGSLLRRLSGVNEVRNRDCHQEADNGHDNHDLDQGKAPSTGCL